MLVITTKKNRRRQLMLTKEELLAVLSELERTKGIVVRVQKDFGDSLLISFSNYLEDTEEDE